MYTCNPCVPVVHRVHVYTVAVLAGVRCAAVLANTTTCAPAAAATNNNYEHVLCMHYMLSPYTLCAWLHRVHAQQQMLAGVHAPAAAALLLLLSLLLCLVCGWVRAKPAAGRSPPRGAGGPALTRCRAPRSVLRSVRCYASLHPPCYSVHCVVLCTGRYVPTLRVLVALAGDLRPTVFHTVCMLCNAQSLTLRVATLPAATHPRGYCSCPLVVGA